MAVEWKKILLEGDAATLSNEDPEAVGTVAAPGVAEEASRDDHVHVLGADCVSGDNIQDDAVGSEHIEALSATLDFNGNQAGDMVLHTVADSDARDLLTPIKGKVVWQTDEGHPFICISEV